jgi:hypothetical protein
MNDLKFFAAVTGLFEPVTDQTKWVAVGGQTLAGAKLAARKLSAGATSTLHVATQDANGVYCTISKLNDTTAITRKRASWSDSKIQHTEQMAADAIPCPVCGGRGNSLTKECPGEALLKHQMQSVMLGTMDFRNGNWTEAANSKMAFVRLYEEQLDLLPDTPRYRQIAEILEASDYELHDRLGCVPKAPKVVAASHATPQALIVTEPSKQAFSDEQLSRVLSAFVHRLDRKTVQSIEQANDECWREQANGNGGSQRSAHDNMESVLQAGIANMLSHDKQVLSKIITEALSTGLKTNG